MIWALRALVFFGAALFFAAEPMAARALLPTFGGSPIVWATTFVFFQSTLVASYVAAHAGHLRSANARLAVVVLAVMSVAGLGSAIALAPLRVEDPSALGVFSALLDRYAIPTLLLGLASPLAQRWHLQTSQADSPTTLFAASNLGSLFGLVAYVLLVEPFVGIALQHHVFLGATATWVALAIACGIVVKRSGAPTMRVATSTSGRTRVSWWVLPAALSGLALSTTQLLTRDVGAFPFSWCAPLFVFLLGSALGFHPRLAAPSGARIYAPHLLLVSVFLSLDGGETGTWVPLLVHIVVLLIVSWSATSELATDVVDGDNLFSFHVALAMGGLIGGVFVAVVAPRVFVTLTEHALLACVLLGALLARRRGRIVSWARSVGSLAPALLGLVLVAVIGKAAFASSERIGRDRVVARSRSPHGVYRVIERETRRGPMRVLLNGATQHGRQLMRPEHRNTPLGYYYRGGALGDVMTVLGSGAYRDSVATRERPSEPMYGLIGLGIGSAIAYAPNAVFRIWEIDPVDVRIAREHFHHLGGQEVVVGDARINVAHDHRRPALDDPAVFDLLFVDAFAGDSVPIHLITKEAIDSYARATRGVVLFHVSSRYYDLVRPLADIAAARGETVLLEERLDVTDPDGDPHTYVSLARSSLVRTALIERFGWRVVPTGDAAHAWTDDRASILSAIRLGPSRH